MIYRSLAAAALLFLCFPACRAQNSTKASPDQKNFNAIDRYFEIADLLTAGKIPPDTLWTGFFTCKANKIPVERGTLDTSVFKAAMLKAYNKNVPAAVDPDALAYHQQYRQHLQELKKHVAYLKSANIAQAVKKYLFPLIPETARNDSALGLQYYVVYGAEDATAGPAVIVNDVLLSYKIDRFALGVLSAHESYHALAYNPFYEKIKQDLNPHDNRLILLNVFVLITEEGVADLIDKKIIFASGSPLKSEWSDIGTGYTDSARQMILAWDRLLQTLNSDSTINISYKDIFAEHSRYIKLAGHWPGRYMAEVIQKNGLLNYFLADFRDPLVFMELYNKAAKMDKTKPPAFSKASVAYFRKIRSYCYK
ncbi:DUF5700 domain-containing putative Zn-dependent protease [Niabella drilacis]|uniref:DUF2268 domain-containing protein n=1 Tax=Niabella drilacis (strain DSM 25811 / CCM 8410 / CCUG 62505 / LMG 26954 / E90) TaxID=1285928 RepID=A0A1G6N996_NIADE|nr:DUF5700 domain-containing putative Zn-dependent protease [Niabella drilacis]SDC64430.1 hypothetical protein SAMN04487894_103200 [Niabella drilacis]